MAAPGQSNLLSAALAIVEERTKMLDHIRELLKSGKDLQALPLMKQYCGIGDEEKGNRIN